MVVTYWVLLRFLSVYLSQICHPFPLNNRFQTLPSPPFVCHANGSSRAWVEVIPDKPHIPLLWCVLAPQIAENTPHDGDEHRFHVKPFNMEAVRAWEEASGGDTVRFTSVVEREGVDATKAAGGRRDPSTFRIVNLS
jgi:hypothetical protein